MINSKGGFTIIEVIMGTALAGLVMLGLAVVYLLGVDAWDRTATRINLQRTASSVLYELTRDIQRADSLEILESGRGLYCRIPPFENDSISPEAVIYNYNNEMLIKKINENSLDLIPAKSHDSLSVELIEGVPFFKYNTEIPTASYEKIVDVNFVIVHKKEKLKEAIPFATTVGARNL